MTLSTKWIIQFLLIAMVFLSSCASIGPKEIRTNRNRYNDVIQDTNNEQLLKNIVRIRYIEPTSFLKLSNVTASYTLNPSISTIGSGVTYATTSATPALSSSVITRVLDVNAGISYSDTPTITYLPVEDAEFVSELMTPVTLENIHMLSYGGIYDYKLLNRLTIQQLGYIDNASAASSAKILSLPRYKEFYHFLDLLVSMRDQFEYVPTKVNGKFAVTIHFLPHYAKSRTANAIRDMFHMPHKGQDILIGEYNLINTPVNFIPVKTRSIYGIMTYLSYGIDIPSSDATDVYHYYQDDGRPFDWTPLMRGIISIHSSNAEPSNVFAKTMTHGHWFYILNSDVDSKATFVLLTRLITLTAGKQLGGNSQGPILTLPAR